MLTGNGRHRRPRQAPALLVAAGVTGSAIAIPLLGAASANAADGTTWDKVAECESGGSWSADTGNGYYGGLQISQDDWDKYGGTQYADTADQASRSQQIAVAEKILAGQGTKPWTMCALTAGLTSNSASVDVDTGVGNSGSGKGSGSDSGSTDESDSSGLSDSSGAGSGHGSGSESSSGSASSSGSDSSADAGVTPSPGPSTDKTPGAGRGSVPSGTPKSDKTDKPGSSDSSGSGNPQGSDTSPTATPGTDESDNPQQAAGSWSLVDTGALSSGGRHRGGSADESVANGQDAASSGRHAGRGPGAYIVREGDTLTSIADDLGVDGGWRALYTGNKKAIGADPNHITAGQTLKVGGEKGAE
ncbi:LysM peptidoglycan-binding domain-containing protein [Streptomyces broussonetiae]|uniref:LysM peptidoglycan-binding domain-containing protein n=1 Tax=Streptomyces broussonetiae TaxID=2686304 RepID=A0A6I6MWN4_9ACTN|nr:transglycosylase family protein [Streptomyces broussonetiae]QHA05138.1 LysM peptidoglycan-binding domain-containing protein [Streptomyces broussonetiae]